LNFETGTYFFIDPSVKFQTAGGTSKQEADVDTWYIGGGIKYRF
jgi:outer membrane protein W